MTISTKPRPYLTWALIARNCAKTLEATLQSLKERTPDAEIIIVDTCSSDSTVEIAKRYAHTVETYRGPNGDWNTEMAAFDDAAAARNYSFSLAHGEIVGWVDADDIIPGPEEAERLLKDNGRWLPNMSQAQPLRADAEPMAPVTLEDALRCIFARQQIGAVWAPYLYRRNEDGTAAEWQERERFVRNDGSHHWTGKGHEVLVPKDPERNGATIATLSSLLFVHMKDWNLHDYEYSVRRHFNALIKEYDRGDRTARTCGYLENFSRILCPWRRSEFLQAYYENANTRVDRCRALLRAGTFAAENGFYMDAVEHFAGAQALRPDLPDVWIMSADSISPAKDHERMALWYERGLDCKYNAIESLMNPRDLVIGYRLRCAEAWRKVARQQMERGRFEAAAESAKKAFQWADLALNDRAIGPDRKSVQILRNCFENEFRGYELAVHYSGIIDFMVRNDEGEKALKLLDAAPWILEDNLLMQSMRAQLLKVRTHLTDPKEYAKFYEDIHTNVPSNSYIYENMEKHSRVKFAVKHLQALSKNRRIRVLEVGSFDGMAGMPILEGCPNVDYVAVDLDPEALVRFRARMLEKGLDPARLTTHVGYNLEDAPELRNLRFDAVVFMEVIEHVADVRATLAMLRGYLRALGHLFISTPWGCGDRGHRIEGVTPHDPRGHVRSLTPFELNRHLEHAGFRVLEQGGDNCYWGATTFAMAERLDAWQRTPVTFAVPSALWDWNASTVIDTGMGASEETIVYLARELAVNSRRQVAVFGPVPHSASAEEEVRESVAYWTRNKIDKINTSGPVVVSRSPAFGAILDRAAGTTLDKILWLQDVHYPDLNEATAKTYRKIVTVSEWHRKTIEGDIDGADVAEDGNRRVVVIPNFLLAEHFALEGAPAREPHHFVYASSPDRGLIRLLKIWPKILEIYPDATLDIFYGWEGCMALGAGENPAWTERYRQVRTEYMALRWQQGITDRGRVNHTTLAREFQRASVWPYVTDFAETNCLTAQKVRAAGCVPVTTRYAGLTESANCSQTHYVDMPGVGELADPTGTPEAFETYAVRFLEALQEAVDTSDAERAKMREEAIEAFDISRILPRWLDILEG